MKKIILLTVVLSLTIGAGIAFAVVTISTPNYAIGGVTSQVFSPSSNVTLMVTSAASRFSSNAKHLNGDRTFGATSTSSSLYYTTATEGAQLADAPAASDSTAFSAWSSL